MPAQAKKELAPELFELINTEQLGDVVEHNVIRMNHVCMIHGQSGAGKSEVIEQRGEALGALVCVEMLGQYETVDLRGSLGVGKDGVNKGLTVWYPISSMPFVGNDNFPDDQIILLFLDELSSASIPVLGVAYQLLLSRRIGQNFLKPNVRIICAGNLDSDRGIVTRMPMPVNNRMTHFKLVIEPAAFVAYCQSVGVPRTFTSFFMFRKDLIATYNPDAPEKVFATPRTWFNAIEIWRDPDMPDWLKEKSIGGLVGIGCRRELYAFAEIEKHVIPLKAILADPEGVELPEELSLCWATAMNVSGSMTLKNVKTLARFINRLEVEFIVMIWTLAAKRDAALSTCPEFIQFSKKYRDVFTSVR